MGITKNEIVTASIRILNRSGIDGLSMRTVARELNIKAASLYNHIRGKAELYGGIAEHICAQYVMPDESLGAREYLTAAAMAYRAILLSVRDSVAIFEGSLPDTPKRLELIMALTERLLQFGVSQKNLVTVSNLFNSYVLSFTADELRIKSRTPEELRAFADKLGPGGGLAAATGRDFDEQFLFGLRLLLSGIEATCGE